MGQENFNENVEIEQKNPLFQVTTVSKYFALVLFILMPFIGGWIGYHYAPLKVVEVEKVVIQEVEETEETITEAKRDEISLDSFPVDWPTYTIEDLGISFKYPPEFSLVAKSEDFFENDNWWGLGPVTGQRIANITNTSVSTEKDHPTIGIIVSDFSNSVSLEDIPSDDFKEGIEVPFDEYVSGEFDQRNYTVYLATVNGIPVLLHKRNYGGMWGNIYEAYYQLDDGRILSFHSEEDNDILDQIYRSLKED